MTAQSIRRDFSVEDVAVVDVASAYDRVRDDIPPCATARDISAVQRASRNKLGLDASKPGADGSCDVRLEV